MHLFLVVALPMAIQVLITGVIVVATRGGGSVVGYAAFLIGMLAVPMTAIRNAAQRNSHPEDSPVRQVARACVRALGLPLMVFAVFLLQSLA